MPGPEAIYVECIVANITTSAHIRFLAIEGVITQLTVFGCVMLSDEVLVRGHQSAHVLLTLLLLP